MFGIINDQGLRLSHPYNKKFIDPSKKCWSCKKESTALKFLEEFKNEGITNIKVIKLDANEEEAKTPGRRGRKPKEQTDEPKFEGYDETSFFTSGYNEKCLCCENDCKQSALAKIIRCPSFKKVKKQVYILLSFLYSRSN